MRHEKFKTILLGALALGNLANGLWMLFSPVTWYYHIPAAVEDTGAMNIHFIRDIGSAYFSCGVALLLAIKLPLARFSLLCVVSAFYFLHAISHIFDIAVGDLPSEHIYLDMPLVFLPVVVLIWFTWWCREPNS